MEGQIITEKEYRRLYNETYKILEEKQTQFDNITTFNESNFVKDLNKFFLDKIHNKPVPFNDTELFLELFEISLSSPYYVRLFNSFYSTLLELYRELNVNNEIRRNIFKCFSIIIMNIYNDIKITDIINFKSTFTNDDYLNLALSYIVENKKLLEDSILKEVIVFLTSIRSNYLDETDYYKACICILTKVIKNDSLNSIKDELNSSNNELLIQEYNNQIELKENIVERIKTLKDKFNDTEINDQKFTNYLVAEIRKLSLDIDKKVNNAILSQSESKLKEFNLKSLYEEIINSVDFKINLHTPYVEEIFKLILLEDKVNVNINLYDEEIKYLYSPMTMGSDCRTIARNLNLKYLQYNESNISDFMNLECFDLIINGGILIFYINHFEKDEQLELFNKLNKIKDYIYYNNQIYKVSDKLKILVISCTKEIEDFVTLDLEEPKAKRKIK